MLKRELFSSVSASASLFLFYCVSAYVMVSVRLIDGLGIQQHFILRPTLGFFQSTHIAVTSAAAKPTSVLHPQPTPTPNGILRDRRPAHITKGTIANVRNTLPRYCVEIGVVLCHECISAVALSR